MMVKAPRILIVEDNIVQRDVLRLLTARYVPNAMIVAVSTGYELLLAYQTGGADLLILDHRLPDVLGSTLLQYLRETGMTTPTILVSGFLPRDTPIDAHTTLLHKPLLVPAFIATMTQALATPSSTVLSA